MSLGERHIETVEGRGGWKVPIDCWESEWRTPGGNFLALFNDMWEVNGYDVSRHDKARQYTRAIPRSYDVLAAIPGSDKQAPLIIRGVHDARDASDIERDLDFNERRSEWGRTESTRTGHERHGIYVMPEAAGKLEPLIEVKMTHYTGGSNGLYYGASVEWLGSALSDWQVRLDSEEAGENNGFGINLKEAEERHRLYMKHLFDGTVELLTVE